jgi:hypothetical protein
LPFLVLLQLVLLLQLLLLQLLEDRLWGVVCM